MTTTTTSEKLEGFEMDDFCRMPNWYSFLSPYVLPTIFVFLPKEDVQALAEGKDFSNVTKGTAKRLRSAMDKAGRFKFISVDTASPTDTERFMNKKRGSTCSAASAWNTLAASDKVKKCAANGDVTAICIRPFRKMDVTREFRLFVKGGELKAMSQYWLIRHYGRLERNKEKYWNIAKSFAEEALFALPEKDVVIDVYVTSAGEVIVNDVNPFHAPTDPLMLNTWEQDWSTVSGIKIVPPPNEISGDINVSF